MPEAAIMASWQGQQDQPLLSIVCLTYNHGHYLSDALHGFLAQVTHFPFEILIHDDASTDDTRELIQQYAKNYPHIIRTILQEKNQFSLGVSPLMTAIPAARGKYIAYCEGDDYWLDTHKAARQVQFLEDHPDYAICYTDSRPFSGKTVMAPVTAGTTRDLPANELKRSPSIFTLTTCFRNAIPLPPEFASIKYGDMALWSLIGHHGKGKYLDDIQPSLYRIHPSGMHSSNPFRKRLDMEFQTYSALFNYYQRIGNQELAEYFFERVSGVVFMKNLVEFKVFNTLANFTKLVIKGLYKRVIKRQ